MALVVWDPITGCRTRPPEDYGDDSHLAALLCGVTGCDYCACHEGPFRVVLVGLDTSYGVCFAKASFPEVGEWSDPCSRLDLESWVIFIQRTPPVLIQGVLYLMLWFYDDRVEILRHELDSTCLSRLDALLAGVHVHNPAILMAMEDGSLGFAHDDGFSLYLWSRKIGSNGVTTWTRCRAISLDELVPIQVPTQTLRLIGSVEGSDIIAKCRKVQITIH
jgi:hypothetical protein